MALDMDRLLTGLTPEEKAALTQRILLLVHRVGRAARHSEDHGSRGPHGLRAQPGEVDHVGFGHFLPATCFPTASAVASAWNLSLLHRIGQALAHEARASNLTVILGPGINMKRSPLCGRNFEYFTEDPYLTGAGRAQPNGRQHADEHAGRLRRSLDHDALDRVASAWRQQANLN
jgi:beta-glucosidase